MGGGICHLSMIFLKKNFLNHTPTAKLNLNSPLPQDTRR